MKFMTLSLAICVTAVLAAGCSPSTTSDPESSGSSNGGPSAVGKGTLPDGAVFPTPETINTGEYAPLSRPLFIYVRKEALKKPVAVEFLKFMYSDTGQELVAETGYINLPESEVAEIQQRIQTAVEEVGGQPADGELNGEVILDGSSTVTPIAVAISEEFSKLHREARVPVGTSGTGGGFKKFIEGVTDINNASRPITESEQQALKEKGYDYLELKVAIDGVTVVVNPENDWVAGMTVDQLKKIWEPNSQVKKWSDVDPSWPDEEIALFGPDTDSGTFDYFTEVICGESRASRSDYQQNTDDNFLVTGVSGDKYALGYFGYAYYVENQDAVKALAIAPSSSSASESEAAAEESAADESASE